MFSSRYLKSRLESSKEGGHFFHKAETLSQLLLLLAWHLEIPGLMVLWFPWPSLELQCDYSSSSHHVCAPRREEIGKVICSHPLGVSLVGLGYFLLPPLVSRKVERRTSGVW